jgi:hypothetical protein
MTVTRLITPTGHLGTTPLEVESFARGCERGPHAIVADSGSADIGPYPLGADVAACHETWQRHDLEAMLLAARRLGVPLVIGSASDTGTDRGVDQYVRLVQEIAAAHRLAPFRLAAIHAEIPVAELARRHAAGAVLRGLDGRPDADAAVLARTDRAVAVMGAEPIQRALAAGADVVIAGRSSDCAIFAAPLLEAGHAPADAFLCGKAMECASFCAEPFMGKETVLGEVGPDGVALTPMHPGQRCTPASVAAHLLYERRSPFEERLPGGVLDLSGCRFEPVDARTTRVTGQRYRREAETWIKIEGAGKVGERALFVLGVRDPYTIAHLDAAIGWARGKLVERFGPPGGAYEVFYHVYGRDAVMGELEPTPARQPLEVGIVVETVAPDPARAAAICHLAAMNLFYARLPAVKGTAGTAAVMSDEVLAARPAYEWTLNHLLRVDDPAELFRTRLLTVGA